VWTVLNHAGRRPVTLFRGAATAPGSGSAGSTATSNTESRHDHDRDQPALLLQLHQGGWRPGTPDHVTGETRRIDARSCRSRRCATRRRRGLAYRPYALGNRYRDVALCETCGFQEEV
jgi:hypothetical protein